MCRDRVSFTDWTVDLDTLGAGAPDDSDEDPSPLALQRFTGALDVRTKPIDYAAFRLPRP